MYQDVFNRVTEYFTGETYEAELAKAKDDYFSRTGRVFEDDPMFETRLSAFFEWYICDRLLWDFGVPPIWLFARMFGENMEEKERTILSGLEQTNHSLFEFVSRPSGSCRVKDLLDNRVYSLTEQRSYAGVERGDVLDGRLIPIGPELVFSSAVWVHPREVKSFILERVKSRRKEEDRVAYQELLLDLAASRWKSEQFQHVPAKQIYGEIG